LCLPLHRLSKGLERGFKDVEELEGAGDWRGVLNVLLKGGKRKGEVWARWEEAAGREMAMTTLAGGSSLSPFIIIGINKRMTQARQSTTSTSACAPPGARTSRP
jgi:hypothetical protein